MAPEQPKWLKHKLKGDRAWDLLLHFGVREYPIRVFNLVDAMNVDLMWKKDLVYETRLQSSWTEATIHIRDQGTRQRQRYAVAHALGHLMLHAIGIAYEDKEIRPDAPEALEKQANHFAMSFLMPNFLVSPLLHPFWGSAPSLEDLARVFDVPQNIMALRIQQLRSGVSDV